jgi:hypothetical protein
MKIRVANRVKVREKMRGSRIRNIRTPKKAANIMVISKMETVMESLNRASLAITSSSLKLNAYTHIYNFKRSIRNVLKGKIHVSLSLTR